MGFVSFSLRMLFIFQFFPFFFLLHVSWSKGKYFNLDINFHIITGRPLSISFPAKNADGHIRVR